MQNGIIGTHIATGQPMSIELNEHEMVWATCTDSCVNECWELMTISVAGRKNILIEGHMDIDQLVVDGVSKTFH